MAGHVIVDDELQIQSLRRTVQKLVDGSVPFGDAEQTLLEEARARFDYEQKAAGALHSKSVFFLTVTTVFTAVTSSMIASMLDNWNGASLEIAALTGCGFSLALFMLGATLLSRSALSRSYQIIAGPRRWVRHLDRIREAVPDRTNADGKTVSTLRHDLLDAWVEAAESCSTANEQKADELGTVSRLLAIATPTTLLSLIAYVATRLLS